MENARSKKVDMKIDDLKVAYNVLIKREHKAEKFLEDTKYTQEKRDSWVPAFNQITECLSLLMQKYKTIAGEEMPIDNVLNGFK